MRQQAVREIGRKPAVGPLESQRRVLKEYGFLDFPGGAVVKNPPANAGDMDSNPGPGRSHVPWSS